MRDQKMNFKLKSKKFPMQRFYADQKSAQAAVKAGDVWGALYFGSNFSVGLDERHERGKDTSDEALEMGELGVWLDMSGKQQQISTYFSTMKPNCYKQACKFIRHPFKQIAFLPQNTTLI
jgi:hypothetical protein